ncbi:MAG: UDP-N-acetylmuramoyl-L-alanyl-D-glutamate--2,6-diaminopimelate ligase [Proteobacteria bacterium]|nr:UDP-N-acetylmuramoyl-L-alanyl-D-glutamate--2,6-diaminopimelate ligase [Pseudomonadota bacterium]
MSNDLSELLNWLDIDSKFLDIKVSGMCLDSRKITHGDVFVALSGFDNHGIDFAYQVQRGGAVAIIAESLSKGKAIPKGRQQPIDIPVVEIENLTEKLGMLASNFYNNPSGKLEIIGITGTNGKTSCAWLMLQAWDKLGIKGAYIGTLGSGTLQQMHDLPNTTPTALELQKILSDFASLGITHVSLEVSSHGLSLGRVNNTKFKGAGLTNISRDHLDFHKTMQQYSDAKKSLFTDFDLDFSIINANDYYGRQWINEIQNKKPNKKQSEVISYGIEKDNFQLNAKNLVLTPSGIDFDIVWKGKSYALHTPLLGKFNVNNLLLVIATLIKQGFNINDITKLIPELNPVPGRMNCVDVKKHQPLIIVDYAHTLDALKQVLLALKEHNARKIWCIFGCGGNRDKGKRPQMGHIAESYADFVIITDDNPRYEDNQQIVQDILMGMNTEQLVIHDREQAIAYAINNAHNNDLILIAGKGHEAYQLINGKYHVFDDRIITTQLLLDKKEQCA